LQTTQLSPEAFLSLGAANRLNIVSPSHMKNAKGRDLRLYSDNSYFVALR